MSKKICTFKTAFFALMGLLISTVTFSQVTVNATGGVATATYTSLRLAFNAVNAGTHTGVISIGISANTTETASCVLNASGAGAASYTAVSLTPTVDGVTVTGLSVAGRGALELNGADNVTIDGDNPNTGGINRNLTILNSASASLNFLSCIRLATSTLITNCDNVTIKNLNIIGSATGRNTAAFTSEKASWGIIASANASTVSTTSVPNTLTTAAILIPSGQTMSNLTISNNNIQTVSRGISVNGSATTVAPTLVISNNLIGNPTIGDVDQVTAIGITVQGTSTGTISGNTVRLESYISSTTISRAINVGMLSTAGVSGVVIEKNNVEKNYNNNVKTRVATGIDISGGDNHIIRNNFVGQCMNSQVAGASAFTTINGVSGIRILGGIGHKIYHNTVHLTGAIAGTAGKNIISALTITTTASTGIDVRNNIFSNQITGGNPTLYNTVLVSMYLPSGATSAMNLTLNNNTYYQGSLGQSGITQVGTTASAANLYKSVNFNPTITTPATNLRSYTNTLSGAATNDNASYASFNTTPVIAPTNLHASFASAELPNIDQKGAASVGVLTDIDGNVRPSASTTIPDIGADEFTVPSCVAANGGTISPAAYSSCVGETVLLTSVGATNATSITYQWMISSSPGGPYTNVTGGSGANTVAYTTPALTAGTNYYILQTTCAFGPLVGLSNEVSITTNTNPVVTLSGGNSYCPGGSTLLTGTAGGTSQWYVNDSLIVGATTNTLAVTSPGSYNMIQTNAFGCIDSANTGITVFANASPTVTASASPATGCTGFSSILNGSGAVSFSWTGGVTNNVSFTPASTLTYTVTGTDGNGCTNTAIQTITVNTLPSVTASALPAILCAGESSVLNGSGASSYTWTSGVTNNVSFIPASTLTYTVTGTDLNGCTNTSTQMVTVNALPTITASALPATLCAGGSAVLSGTGAPTISWTGGITNNISFIPASTTTYTVTGTDGNGCTGTSTQTLTVNALPTITASALPSSICIGETTTLMGAGGSTYAWTSGVTDNVGFTPSSSATYTVTGTDLNGCTGTSTQSVSVNSLPILTASATPAAVCTGGSTILAGSGASSYTWTGGISNGVSFIPVTTGTYTVTGTDLNGCTNTVIQSVTVNGLPTVTANSSAPAVCAGTAATLNGGGASTYVWDNSVMNGVAFTPTGTLTYNVTGTDVNGCTNTASTTITVNPLPTASFTPFASSVCDNASSLTLSGGSPAGGAYSGTFVSGGMFDPTAAGAGMYLITYTYSDVNSCMDTDTASITVDVCSGIALNNVVSVNIYPNPGNGLFTLSVSNADFSEMTISIMDVQGKTVYTSLESVSQGYTKEIRMTDMAQGIYTIKVATAVGTSFHKLIVQ